LAKTEALDNNNLVVPGFLVLNIIEIILPLLPKKPGFKITPSKLTVPNTLEKCGS